MPKRSRLIALKEDFMKFGRDFFLVQTLRQLLNIILPSVNAVLPTVRPCPPYASVSPSRSSEPFATSCRGPGFLQHLN